MARIFALPSFGSGSPGKKKSLAGVGPESLISIYFVYREPIRFLPTAKLIHECVKKGLTLLPKTRGPRFEFQEFSIPVNILVGKSSNRPTEA